MIDFMLELRASDNANAIDWMNTGSMNRILLCFEWSHRTVKE